MARPCSLNVSVTPGLPFLPGSNPSAMTPISMNDLRDFGPVLYIPADRRGLTDFLFGKKSALLPAIAICLEDAIRTECRHEAVRSLSEWLPRLITPRTWRLYLRPSDDEMLVRVLDLPGISHVDGFIVPKASPERLAAWARKTGGRFALIPIIETRDALDSVGRLDFGKACADLRQLIPRVRIGANDLFALLGGLRRPRGRTIYETPVGHVIDSLIEVFSGIGIPLSGSVFDRTDDMPTLERETHDDVARGLFSKTALNPAQAKLIAGIYRPEPDEIEEARCILHPDSPAVFSLHGTMHERACHLMWAKLILQRSAAFQAFDTTHCFKSMDEVHKPPGVAVGRIS